MTFFNPKEEVLDVQLTQYGRHLLSKGTMKPMYYAFFDEGVVYDSRHMGPKVQEGRSDAEDRIQDATPSLKTRHSFTGREEFLYDGINDIEDRKELGIYERLLALTDPLGTTELGSEKMPYLSLSFLDGEIKKSVNHQTGSTRTTSIPSPQPDVFYSQQILKIPQITVDAEYKVAVIDPNDPQIKFDPDPILSSFTTYKNGLSVAVGTDDIVILVEEGNTTCKHENFDIEVFEMTGLSGSLGEEVMVPMAFKRPLKMMKNNLLLDVEEARREIGLKAGEEIEIDSSFVGYYLDIKTDKQINRSTVCDLISKVKKKGVNISSPCGIDFDCPEEQIVVGVDIYSSDADPESCI
jgi:hypothetical protein